MWNSINLLDIPTTLKNLQGSTGQPSICNTLLQVNKWPLQNCNGQSLVFNNETLVLNLKRYKPEKNGFENHHNHTKQFSSKEWRLELYYTCNKNGKNALAPKKFDYRYTLI